MAHIQAPLVGDPVYGGRHRLPRDPSDELKRLLQSFPRQALHAVELAFDHPLSQERMRFASEVPADIAALLHALKDDRERATR